MRIDRSSVRYGAALLAFVNICIQLLGFVYRIALSRLIGAEGMGLFQLIFPFYGIVISVTLSGVTMAVSRLTSEYSALGKTGSLRRLMRLAVAMFAAVLTVMSILVFVFSRELASGFLGDARVRPALCMLMPCLLFAGLGSIHKNFFYGLHDVTPPAAAELFESLLRLITVPGLLFLILPQPFDITLAAIVFGMLLCEIMSFAFIRAAYSRVSPKSIPRGGASGDGLIRKIASIAIPVSATSLAAGILSSLNVIIIPKRLALAGYVYPQALSLFGVLFGMSIPLLTLPSAVISALSVVLVPKLAESSVLKNEKTMHSRISRSIVLTSVCTLPAIAAVAPIGAALGKLLYNQPIAGENMPLLAVFIALSNYQGIFSSILNGVGRQKTAAAITIADSMLHFIMTWALTALPRFGISGYIIGGAASTAFGVVLCLYFIKKYTGVRIDVFSWFAAPLLSALLGGLCSRLFYLSAMLLPLPVRVLFAGIGGGFISYFVIFLLDVDRQILAGGTAGPHRF